MVMMVVMMVTAVIATTQTEEANIRIQRRVTEAPVVSIPVVIVAHVIIHHHTAAYQGRTPVITTIHVAVIIIGDARTQCRHADGNTSQRKKFWFHNK